MWGFPAQHAVGLLDFEYHYGSFIITIRYPDIISALIFVHVRPSVFLIFLLLPCGNRHFVTGLCPYSSSCVAMIGAIDQGTTSTRFFLYDDQGHAVASHQMALEQIKPKAGYAGILQYEWGVVNGGW